MTNKVNEGDRLELTAPYDVASGAGALVGTIFGVACDAYASGAAGVFEVKGVFDINKKSTDTPTQGAALYWDNTAKELTTTSTSNTLVARAVSAAGSGVATVRARLI